MVGRYEMGANPAQKAFAFCRKKRGGIHAGDTGLRYGPTQLAGPKAAQMEAVRGLGR
jgi:hypothetical protein